MSDIKYAVGAEDTAPASLHVLSLITSYRVTQILHVAAVLGIADLLAGGPKQIGELAAATATHGPALSRVLRALASIGVFAEIEHGQFALTPLGDRLRSDVPGSMRAWAIMVGGEHHWRALEQLTHTLRTGEPAFEHVFGTGPFEYYSTHPEAGQVFHAALTGLGQVVNPAIARGYDFSGSRRIIDIGGGAGSLLASLLDAYPGAHGALFDLPEVIARAARLFADRGLGDRCELIAGDFFEGAPDGGDVYLLKHILHDWDDERAVTILRNCRRAMAPESRLLVIEIIIPKDNAPCYGKLLDIEMLSAYRGRERTLDEYRALYEAAGLQLARVVPTGALVSLIEGIVA